MFYYLSFLRPPPLQASTDVAITPQISNDLRTEYLDCPVDIYYAWSRHDIATTPAKLTTWRPSTPYKKITVPRPPVLGIQDPDWRLILACGAAQGDQVVMLGETDTTGRAPCPVMSMSVMFPCCERAANTKKQERIVRSYALHGHPIVFDIIEQTSFDLDKKIWDSGIGLSSWLVQFFSANLSSGRLSDLRDALFSTDARHILELGAGTGIVTITLAILRSTLELSDQPGTIVATDLPSAIPILQDNIASNHAVMQRCTPHAAVLDWEQAELPPPVQSQLEGGSDVIIMADVTYNTASFPALIATLSRLVQRSNRRRHGRPPMVLMGYKERHPDERSLWDDARAVGLHFEYIARVNGAGGNPVEIWLA